MRATNSQGGKIPLFLLWGAVIFIAGLTCGLLWSPRQPGLRSQIEQSLPQTNESKDIELSKMRQEAERARVVYEQASGENRRSAARDLIGNYAGLAKYLGEGKKKNIPEAISILKEGLRLEEKEGLSGSETSTASFVDGYLIDRWVNYDGDSLLQYLQSPEVSMKEKKDAIDYLKETIEKEYPSKE